MKDALAVDVTGEERVLSPDRGAMAQATRLIQPAISGVSSCQQLLSAPAAWAVLDARYGRLPGEGPRLQSPRHRGVAPAFPDADRVTHLQGGTLVVFPGGMVLEPSDVCRPCIHVSCSTVQTATFYRDAFEVMLSSCDRYVVRTDAVEHVDSIFQAYFWNPMT